MSEKRPGIDKVVEYLRGLKKPTVVDLGAHTGKTTQIWLDAGARLVVAVEPYRSSFAALESRFAKDKRVTAMSCAVGLSEGEVPLYTPDKFKGKDRSQGCTLHRAALKDKKRKGRLTDYGKHLVKVKMLSSVLMGPCDLLKVNIEGGEYDILGAVPSDVRAMFVSWHFSAPFDTPEYEHRYAELCLRFMGQGYKLISKESRGDHLWEFWKNEDSNHPD